MSDRIPVAFPTAEAARAKSRNRGEKAPVVFTIPRGVHMGGTNIGSMKIRVDVGTYGSYDPGEPFCATSIAAGEAELFSLGNDRRSKTTLKVDAAELAAALEDWAAASGLSRAGGRRDDAGRRPEPKTPPSAAAASTDGRSEGKHAERGDLDCRIEAAYRAAALIEAERAAARKKGAF